MTGTATGCSSLNYNPKKDEDFSEYYNTYKNSSYNGTGILFPVCEEVSSTEEALKDKIYPGRDSQYELIEYLNDINREYAEVLVEQNQNSRTDTVYTYGVERLSRELFNKQKNTSHYLYDGRGNVTGLSNREGQLCATYRYDDFGGLLHGGKTYENEYTFNGESYNPNIKSQYLRARYYNVTTASFLTEDSIVEGLVYFLEPLVAGMEWVDRLLEGNPTSMREISAELHYNLETYLDTNADMAEDKTAFYAGRCVGSVLVIAAMHKAGSGASANGSGGNLSSGGSMVLVTPDGCYINAGGSAGLVLPSGVLAGDAPLGDWKNQIEYQKDEKKAS